MGKLAQHISIRIPWKDNGYNGFVCDKPCYNNACLRLKNIAENKDDLLEEELSGCPIKGNENRIPCLSEGGAFMSSVSHSKITVHPYKASNPKTHGHFQDTELVYPPFSLPARPFGWTMLRKGPNDNIGTLKVLYNIDFDEAREPSLSFDTNWVQDAENQRSIFDCFYKNVIPQKSLVIIYAKQVPFIEDSKRVVMGIGFVDKVTPPVEHNTDGTGKLRSITWETMIGHTIRDDRKNGFLFPYKEMMEYAEAHPEFDIRKVTVFAADEYFDEFSYATEHLSYDAGINVLMQSLKALNIIKDCIDGDWNNCINWVNTRISEVWEDRGAYPGIGTMLCAAGFPFGILIAEEIKKGLKAGEDIWNKLDVAIECPQKNFSQEIAKSISSINQRAWKCLNSERKNLFKLLSRFSLTLDQAYVIYNVEQREEFGLACTDKEIIENPYILYEQTRDKEPFLQIAVSKVDMAVFPPIKIQEKYPLPKPSCLSSDNDERRIRAIAISILESQTQNGHTIYPCNKLIIDMNELAIAPKCNVNKDVMDSIADFLEKEIVIVKMKNGDNAYQLFRLQEIDKLIRNSIIKRINSKKRHVVDEDWRVIIDKDFGETKEELEIKARQEKAAILKELAESRLSALIGGAGTGKTTLLALLCSSKKIEDGSILLLAPTGKARVKMSQEMASRNIRYKAKTVAQFLIQNGRFNFDTMRYSLSDIPAKDIPETVIIDESSMLTEEMFGALIQALKPAGRIIFVGDSNQLPPIGAGRPFVDLVRYLKKDLAPNVFPKVCKSYGELIITRRQKVQAGSKERLDTELAKWFINDNKFLDEEIFEKIQGNNGGEFLTFKTWKTNEELEKCILDTLMEEIGMSDHDDVDSFDRSLGGNVTNNGTYFNVGCAKFAEDWQILAPVRNMPYGVISINRLIHNRFRENLLTLARKTRYKKIPSPMGAESIVYGDKVINLVNKKRSAFPATAEATNYVANGEIGIVAGSFGKQTKYLNVEFSSQQGFTYSYNKSDFGEEIESPLELAYALTVHKAQGSDFKKVFLVLKEPCNLISKELLYTAITRQKNRIVILYNDEAYHLKNYSNAVCSDIAKRFTNLFEEPEIVAVNDKYYEAGLIHKTLRGELVRSKSEVIIANMLFQSGIFYEYEKDLRIDNIRKIPDFTIDDQDSGETVYWEHCGMMSDPEYKKKWEAKKQFYEEHGIIEGENLIVTYDEQNGSVDSQKIQKYIDKFFN